MSLLHANNGGYLIGTVIFLAAVAAQIMVKRLSPGDLLIRHRILD